MLSCPGLMVPVMAFPFQSSTMNRSLPCTVFPAHVPIHDPFNGWPSCAITGAPAAHNADNARATTNVRIFKLPLGQLLADLEPFELHIQHVVHADADQAVGLQPALGARVHHRTVNYVRNRVAVDPDLE